MSTPARPLSKDELRAFDTPTLVGRSIDLDRGIEALELRLAQATDPDRIEKLKIAVESAKNERAAIRSVLRMRYAYERRNPLEWKHWPWMVAGGAAALGGIYWLSRPTAFLGPVQPPPALPPGVASVPVRLPLGTIPLEQGRHYFGIVQPGATVYFFASRAQVVAYAQKRGWTNVQAYVKASELPTWWPADGRESLANTFYVEADWGQASQQFQLPSQVTAAWILGPEILPS